ncbi:hypothetical protein UlMin_013418 [Ulmus minor]
MRMDPTFDGFPDFPDGFKINNQIILSNSYQYPVLPNDYQFNQLSQDFDFANNQLFLPPDPDSGNFIPSIIVNSDQSSTFQSSGLSPDGGSYSPPSGMSPGGDSSDDGEFSETVLKYISQILMEEKMEEKPCMFYDPLGLQDTEKSFYDALGENYPYSSHRVDTPESTSSNSTKSTSSTSTGTITAGSPQWPSEEYRASLSQNQPSNENNFQLNVGNGFSDSSVNEFLADNIFRHSNSVSQFQRGLEEASKFLPKGNPIVIDLESISLSLDLKGEAPKVVVKTEKVDGENSPSGSRTRKNHEREDTEPDEERSNKQSAVYGDERAEEKESELSEMFDRVLLYKDGGNCNGHEAKDSEGSKALQPTGKPQGSTANAGKARAKKQGKKKDTVDLRNLLILCAQAVSANDRRTAQELLKQIRQHSNTFGDGSQRLAHYFANGLEARLAGTSAGCQIFYASLISKRTSAAEILKSFQVHLSACPFKKISLFFANKMILKAAEKATSLHIVDFGILYGFQWPILIQHLANRPGGPPKLRITGIELPQKGFRPTEQIEETGRRLKKYCERFGVPFQYNAIASQNWETIPIEDIKIDSNEVLAVNSLMRFKNLMDETIDVNCPRNAVLNLIRKMNPDIFVQSIVNGSYNAPFFVTRFREALFHFSALFDMLDTNLSRQNEERLMFEKEFYGREAMNVISCEGLERVEKPETYKQWYIRNTRAGFRSLPLDQELMNKFRDKLKACYHKDFVIDQDNNWMLQGWKGRIVYASTCWVPA